MCLSVFLLGFILYGTLHFLDLGGSFLCHVREVFDYNLFKYFLGSFLSLFSFWDPYNANVVALNVVPEVSQAVFISFHSFSLVCSAAVNSTILSSRSLIRSSASVILLLIPSGVVFISIIVLFISVCLFVISPSSLLSISYVFLVCASILFLRSWIIFTIISLNYFF